MAFKFSTMCDLDGAAIKHNLDEIAAVVRNPNYICAKCGRIANKKKFLCKGKKLPK